MWVSLITIFIILEVISKLVFFRKYKNPKILRYDLDWGSQELIILFQSILFNPFIYFSIMFRLNIVTTLLVIIITSLLYNK